MGNAQRYAEDEKYYTDVVREYAAYLEGTLKQIITSTSDFNAKVVAEKSPDFKSAIEELDKWIDSKFKYIVPKSTKKYLCSVVLNKLNICIETDSLHLTYIPDLPNSSNVPDVPDIPGVLDVPEEKEINHIYSEIEKIMLIEAHNIIRICCIHDWIHHIKKIIQLTGDMYQIEDPKKLFIDTCKSGHVRTAEWILSTYNLNLKMIFPQAFDAAEEKGKDKTIIWLINARIKQIESLGVHAQGLIIREKKSLYCDIKRSSKNMLHRFDRACQYGQVQVAKIMFDLLIKDNPVYIAAFDYKLIINTACMNNYLDVIKFICNYVIPILVQNCDNHTGLTDFDFKVLFKLAVEYNRIDIVKWIYETNRYIQDNVHFMFTIAFNTKKACVKTLEWILSLNKLSIEQLINIFLKCKYIRTNHEDFNVDNLRWLYGKYIIEFTKNKNVTDVMYIIFNSCVRSGDINNIAWFYSNAEYPIIDWNYLLMIAIKHKQSDMIQWIRNIIKKEQINEGLLEPLLTERGEYVEDYSPDPLDVTLMCNELLEISKQ